MRIRTLILFFISFSFFNVNGQVSSLKKGEFIYSEYKPLANKPVKVWYFIPTEVHNNSPIVFVMHGNSRNAEGYRNAMIASAKENQFILIVPEFSKKYYPKVRDYHHGGLFDSNNELKRNELWTFSIIEPLFDAIKNRFNNVSETYYLYGFSAGSQFVHRFMYMIPNNRASKIVSAAAGTYTMPYSTINYSYGIKNLNIPVENLSKLYSKDLIVAVGSADTVLARKDLVKTKEANKQGRDRVERAYKFFNESRKTAQGMKMDFNWKIVEIPNVGHSQAEIAKPIAELLFNE